MGKRLPLVTNSAMTTFRRCQREYHYSYELGYRSADDAEALRIGTLIHTGLELWWNGLELDCVLEKAVEGAANAFEAAKVRVMLRGYDARWSHERARFVVVGVEHEFRAPLRNPLTGAASRTYDLGGKVDVLLEHGIVEHKTTSSDIGVGSTYWRKLAMNSQVSTYFAGARALGVEPVVCVYDVLRKPGQRPSQVPVKDDSGFKVVLDANGERVYCKNIGKAGPKPRETADAALGYVLQTRPETVEEYEARISEDIAAHPDKYYQRGEVVRLENEEREAALDAWQITQLMRESAATGAHPRNADACERFGGMCSFFEVCTGTATLEDAARFVRVENVHQELNEAAAE